jgi:hypothetical protein
MDDARMSLRGGGRFHRGQLEVFMTQWRHIEALTSERGPFSWRVSRTAMTSMPPD